MTMTTLHSALLVLAFTTALFAQHDHHHQQPPPGTYAPNKSTSYLLSFSSGTSLNPASWPMPMVMTKAAGWHLMWMGQAFLVSTQQSGSRGSDKLYSANWGMLAAARNIGKGSLMLRGMVSLDPVTVRGKRYPLLFQTGETADGAPIVDGQHPHDAIMELSIHYARPLSIHSVLNVYYAPAGDAALGPVAFPHRASAMELPQATLGHHWQDATHITNNVLTLGLTYRTVRFEASSFRGKEPNENRWNIDMGGMDSWSGRLTWQPSPNWLAQVSAGHLRRPETFHLDNVLRTTASLHYTTPAAGWSTSVIWSRNRKSIGRYATNSFLAETVRTLTRNNLITARYEWSQRDELFEYDHNLAHELLLRTGKRAFDVNAFTIGYTRQLRPAGAVRPAAGMNFTAYAFAGPLKPFYGARPTSVSLFLRFRLHPGEENHN
ncbi:MAG: hypothetical protein JNK48_28795 [Bryobacterales bacterium]|nr:hypothetical protein [Bryobacterales bacterium]